MGRKGKERFESGTHNFLTELWLRILLPNVHALPIPLQILSFSISKKLRKIWTSQPYTFLLLGSPTRTTKWKEERPYVSVSCKGCGTVYTNLSDLKYVSLCVGRAEAETDWRVQCTGSSQHSLYQDCLGQSYLSVFMIGYRSHVVSLLQITTKLKAGLELGQITQPIHFITSFPICKQDDNNCPQTSKGGDDDCDLKNNNYLLSSYYGSSTVQDTLHMLYLILTNLQHV